MYTLIWGVQVAFVLNKIGVIVHFLVQVDFVAGYITSGKILFVRQEMKCQLNCDGL